MGLKIEKLDTTEDVYDFQVGDTLCFFANGILVHNSEIILRDKQFCNLTEIILRALDSVTDIKKKVRIATILGTFQATLTKFNFLSEKWKNNTEEEALLGVSMTGIVDNSLTAGLQGKDKLSKFLDEMREYAVEVNKEWAGILGIKPAAAITAVKPSGCTSLETKVKTTTGASVSMAELFVSAGYEIEGLENCLPGTFLPVHEGYTLPHVLDENNEPQAITNLYINGADEVFEIAFEDGNTYKFTGNHKLKLKTGEWKRVDELTEGDDIESF